MTEQLTPTLTDDWIEVYDNSKRNGEDFAKSIWWRLAASEELAEGVDADDPRVIEAVRDIKSRIEAKRD